MRVLLAGAGGAIGRPLTAMLLEAGHEVTGTSRSADGAAKITAAGARGIVLDLRDAAGVHAQLAEARPEVVIDQVTDLGVPTAEGLTDAQIAERLVLSRRTVTSYLTSVYSKLGVSSRSAATRWMLEQRFQ